MGVSYDAMDPDLLQGMRELEQWLGSQNILTTITSTVRSSREQQFLWDRYQKGQADFPAAPPGHSAHEYGWAFDMIVSPVAYQAAVGRAWVQYWGGTYGGKKDPVHFELPGASKLAWQLGESGAQPVQGQAGGAYGLTPEDAPIILKLFDIGLSFTPLGLVQIAELLAQVVAPASGKYDRILSALINTPAAELWAWAQNQ
jgi:hypothetical protein